MQRGRRASGGEKLYSYRRSTSGYVHVGLKSIPLGTVGASESVAEYCLYTAAGNDDLVRSVWRDVADEHSSRCIAVGLRWIECVYLRYYFGQNRIARVQLRIGVVASLNVSLVTAKCARGPDGNSMPYW